jgi:cerevisin
MLSNDHLTGSSLVNGHEYGIHHVYDRILKGYAGRFSDITIDRIRSMPKVAYVERDQVVLAQETQSGAPWVCLLFDRGLVKC